MRAKGLIIWCMFGVYGYLSQIGGVLAEPTQNKDLYKCIKNGETTPIYSHISLSKSDFVCEKFNAPKASVKKISNEKFDKLSRARIAKLTGKSAKSASNRKKTKKDN